jgi:PAS domain S-box-containing protein
VRDRDTSVGFGSVRIPEDNREAGSHIQAVAGLTAERTVNLAGILTAALGLVVLFGYHLGKTGLVQGHSWLSPMAYTTAVSFALLGGALLALNHGWRIVSRTAAGGAGLLILFSMIEHAGGHIPDVLALPSVLVAPNTAFAIASLALAMLLLSAGSQRWSSMVIVLGLLAASIGVNAFGGYLTGLPTYGWGMFQPMAIHTSIGVILLSSGILTLSWRGALGNEKRRTVWLVATVLTGGVVTSVSFWQALASLERVHVGSALRARSWMPETVLFAGVAVTALLGMAVHLASVARLRTALAERMRYRAEEESAQRKVALAALTASENLLRSVIDTSTDYIFVKDRNLRTILCNQTFAKALGKPVAEVCGKTDVENGWGPERVKGVPAEGVKGREQDDLRALAGETVHVIDELGTIADGIHYLDTVKTPLRGGGDEITGLVGMSRDITEQKLALDEIRLGRERLALAQKAGHSGAFDWDIRNDVNIWTPEVEALYGIEPGKFGGRYEDWEALVLPEDLDRARAHLQNSLITGEFAAEWRIRRISDREIRWLAARAKVFFDKERRPIRMIGINTDVTERKQAGAALEQSVRELARSNAELQQFAYVASHDLQEPLRIVASFTQLLADRYSDKLDQDAREFIGYAVDGATRMQTLIRDLLSLSRVGTKGKDFGMVQFDEALGQALKNLQFAIRESGALVTHDALPAAMGDSSQIAQVFQNLIGNAVKFRGAEPPRIHVSAVRTGDEWTFSVRDNGIGFEPQYSDRIFAVFQRLHGLDEYAGTGIGLAICKKIVERHHGRIWAESKPGSGSTFSFTTPTAGVGVEQLVQGVETA